MKVALITPTRGDRPQFLSELKKMIAVQTVAPAMHIIVDDKHSCTYKDVTWRYRLGFKRALEQGADVFIIMEDDDWYAPTYIQDILTAWVDAGTPTLFGIGNTMYYNLAIRRYIVHTHPARASMMSTLMIARNSLELCNDNNPFLDIHLWSSNHKITKSTVVFDRHISIGIKHGLGVVAGNGHTFYSMYIKGHSDDNLELLRSYVGDDLIDFYESLNTGIKPFSDDSGEPINNLTSRLSSSR